jgi:hypothetical protein
LFSQLSVPIPAIVCSPTAELGKVRRGHYEPAVEEAVGRRVAVAFDELALAM